MKASAPKRKKDNRALPGSNERLRRTWAGEARRAGEERLRFLLEMTNAIPWEANANTWRFTYIGPQAVELLGYSTDQWYEKDFWATHIHPEDREFAIRFCEKSSCTAKNYEFEYRMIAADGRVVWLHDIVNVQSFNGAPETLRGFLFDITERRQAQDVQQARAERHRSVVQTAASAIILLSPDLKILEWNCAAARICGWKRDEVLGKDYLELLLPKEVRESVAADIQKVLAGQPTESFENPIRTRDGAERSLSWNVSRLVDAKDRAIGIVAIGMDITEHKQAEEALHRSENRYRTLFESSPYCIHEIDIEGRLYSMNSAGLHMMGVTDERDIKGMPYLDVVSDDDRDRIGKVLALAYQGNPLATEFLAVNGVFFQSSFVPITDDNDVVIKLMGLTQDITERKRAQRELENALSEVARLKDQLQAENIYLREEIDLGHNFGEIIGQNSGLKKLLVKVEQVATTDATVLILGETGTGKELVARAIHRLSQRKDRPLVKVSCAALPPSLIECELFGHEKGAFTNAISRQVGRFELADGATIFLDEIGELPLNLQAKLLRVLQEGEFERLGNPRTFKVDVRIIAATNRDLEEAVRDGGFRADLYHRLSVFPLALPPLRERKEDIPLLVRSFVNSYEKKVGKAIDTIPETAMNTLQSYSWPGNVRELENVIERAVIVTPGTTLRMEDVLAPSQAVAAAERVQTLEHIERDHINRILQQTRWRIEGQYGAAVALGLRPATLRSRMRKLGIHRPPLATALNR